MTINEPAKMHSLSWRIYQGTGHVLDEEERNRRWPPPPHWRDFQNGPDLPCPPADEADTHRRLGDVRRPFPASPGEVDIVNAAIYLRRPLLVTLYGPQYDLASRVRGRHAAPVGADLVGHGVRREPRCS